ncbi:MAG: T9SS type A sorting domain-containing protein [Bacteroidales bacterium]|nr:T9SS type A sorting domain-containing protein [Bacteroidales bacterium]
MLRQKINIIFLISLFLIILSKSALPQQVGVNSVTVRFVQPPTTWSVEKAALKYNKDFSFCMHLDDGKKDIYSHAFQFLNGGSISGTPYPGKFYTDGCGNDIKFKMSAAVFSLEQNGAVDGHDPNGPYANMNVTWPELIEIYQAGWAVYNHGLTSSSSLDPYYSIRRNHSYIKLKMLSATEGGPEFKVHVNPNGASNFTPIAFQEDYIMALRQISFGVPSIDVTTYTFGNPLEMGRTSLENNFIFSTLVDNAAALSVNGAHHWGTSFAHFITGNSGFSFPVFRAQMNYVEAIYGKTGSDNIWMTTEEEVLEYLFIKDAVTVNSQLTYTDLIITFSGNIQTDLRHYALSLVVSGNVPIDTIFIDGGTNHSFNGIGNDTMLINLNWNGYVMIPDTVNAETYVGIAEQSFQQYDWNIAMDYVEMIPPGDAKEAFRDRLCVIPGTAAPEGYCFCTTNAGNDTTICESYCVTLTVTEGVSYLWSTGDTTQSIFVCPVDTTTYYVTVYNEIGCPATDSVTVNIAPNPNANAGNDTTICDNNCIILTASGGTSYLWSTNDTTQSIEVCPEYNTEYSVIVTSQYGCQANDTVIVSTNPSPVANAGNDTTICIGDCATLTGSGNGDYLWNTGDTTQNIIVCPEDTTIYWLTITNDFFCSDTDSVSVNVNPLPIPEAGNDTTICNGDSTILTASGGILYLWNTGDTTQSITVSPNDTTQYFVTVTNENNCSAEDSVTVNILPSPVAFAGNDTIICFDDCANLSASGGISYLWNTGDTTANIYVCPLDTTNYYVTVSNDLGCTNTDTVTVSVNPIPNADAGPDTTICQGICVTLYASGGDSCIWDHGDTTFWTTVCPDTTTIYYVSVFDNIGCSARDSVTVFIIPGPIIVLTPDTGICVGGDSITLTVSGGVSYLWENQSTSTSIKVAPNSTKYYSVFVTNELGCTLEDSVRVELYPLANPLLGNDTTICAGNSITLAAQNGAYFLWNTGDSTSKITVYPEDSSIYYVSIVSTYGCQGSDTINIYTNPITEVSFVNLLPVYCENDGEIVLLGDPPGGIFSGHGVFGNIFNTEYAGAGQHKLIYSYLNSFGCSSFVNENVFVYTMPSVNLGNDTTICIDTYYSLNAGGGYDSYLWTNGSTDSSTTIYPEDYGEGILNFIVFVTKDACVDIDTIKLNIIYCDPGIEEIGNQPLIHLFPNPANNSFSVFIDGNEKTMDMQILNSRGQEVYSENLINCSSPDYSKRINSSMLPKGLYFVKFYNGNFILVKRLIIN